MENLIDKITVSWTLDFKVWFHYGQKTTYSNTFNSICKVSMKFYLRGSNLENLNQNPKIILFCVAIGGAKWRQWAHRQLSLEFQVFNSKFQEKWEISCQKIFNFEVDFCRWSVKHIRTWLFLDGKVKYLLWVSIKSICQGWIY